MNPKVDSYLAEGCGRCPLGGTPQCKVNNWREAMTQLRRIVLDCGLAEELKWSVPCYTYKKKNILLLHAFKEYCGILFHKGALLQDAEDILIQQTENVQAARQIRFTDAKKVIQLESILRAYIYEAVEVEKAGLEVAYKETSEFKVPGEFQQVLNNRPEVKSAFEALTPGRQRGYLLHFAQPKQSKTREARIEKWLPQIFDGKGIHDR